MATRGLNKHCVIGNLGQDPVLRYFPDGTAVVNISIATTEIWKDRQTQQQKERTDWHNAVATGKTAENIAKFLKKGSKVYIEGPSYSRKWKDEHQQERYTQEIRIQDIQFLDNNNRTESSTQNAPAPTSTNPAPSPSGPMAAPPVDFDDDIPFAGLGLQYPMLLNCM